MIEYAIQQLRRYESGAMSPSEARAFIFYTIDSGLVWCTPGMLGVIEAMHGGPERPAVR